MILVQPEKELLPRQYPLVERDHDTGILEVGVRIVVRRCRSQPVTQRMGHQELIRKRLRTVGLTVLRPS